MPAEIHGITSFDDVQALVTIHNTIWQHSVGIIDLLAHSSDCYLSRDSVSKAVTGYAFVVIDTQRNGVELNDIAVDPQYRHRGHGTAIIRHIMAQYRGIRLCADAGEEKLIRFYHGLGFETDAVYENYYDVGRDALRLVWRAGE